MGQQQLLLIVLGVIIVGVAVVVGIQMFNTSAEQSTKDVIASEMLNLGAMAQQYYKRPVQMGGGGGAFDNSKGGAGFSSKVPTKLSTTDNATYALTVAAQSVTIVATPNGDYTWTASITVNPSSMSAITGL